MDAVSVLKIEEGKNELKLTLALPQDDTETYFFYLPEGAKIKGVAGVGCSAKLTSSDASIVAVEVTAEKAESQITLTLA